jgi:hypothetical protein
MKARTPLLAFLAIGALLALAPAGQAATPFTAGMGNGHDLAVGSDGTGHVVWLTDEAADRVGYCRIPAGGSACDSASGLLDFPGLPGASSAGDHAQVFTPAPNKVVIQASCTNCTGVGNRTFRFVSLTNGADFGPGGQVGSLELNGQSAFINAGNVALSVSGRLFQGEDAPPSETTELTLGETPSSVYDASAAVDPGGTRAVYAVNDLDNVRYRVFTDPGTAGITAAELNANTMGTPTYWSATKLLSAPEGNNDETHLGSGPNGVFLTYRFGQPTENRIGLRRFDAATNTFGAASYIEGDDAIENNGIGESHHSQDASGRLHVVWRSLFDGNRLRYRRSDDGGATFTPAANLATHETFLSPYVEAGPSGTGFAAWRSTGSAIRVVPIDPQPEPSAPGGGGPDTTAPTAGGFVVDDTTLFPGEAARFSFNSSEAGVAVLTIQKRVKGMKVRIRGRLRCVPQTRRRIRALHGRRLRRCRAYKRIGSIRQAVSPGRNTIRFSGRIAGRRLRPGRYRALLVITDAAGNVSRVERMNFRVLRRRR